MKLTDAQRKVIVDRIESLFENTKARLLGRLFKGPKVYFEVVRRADPLHTIEGIYNFTLKTLYGSTTEPDKKTVENLSEITSDYMDAQQLKIKNHILADVAKAKTPSEAIRSIRDHFDKAGRYVDMLVANETKIAQAYASREGITKLASDIGVKDPTVVFLGVCDHRICKYCKSMYHDSASIQKPKPYKLSQVQEGYFRAKDWDGKTPHQAPLHPRCFDKGTEVLTNEGWKLFKDLNGDELFLSMNMYSGVGEWVRAVKQVSYHYTGNMVHFSNRSTDLMVTTNHINPIYKRRSNRKGKWLERRMLDTESLLTSGEWSFITSIECWEGNSNDVVLDGKNYVRSDLCEFMGYFLSEGWLRPGGAGTFRIEIAQEKYPKPMIDCVKKLFQKNNIYYKHGKIVVYLPNSLKELKNFLNRGKSFEKDIPSTIKESDRRNLQIFLDAYLLGDGSIRSRMKLRGQKKPSIERTYHTSSDKMASDLGEIILKLGYRPSYYKAETKESKHWNGTYLTKHPCWLIRQNNPSSPRKENLTVKHVMYDDIVYDVELERNHTLYVRRNGRVQLSGNCRHVLVFVPPNMGYDNSGTIVFREFGYEYYKDYWKLKKDEEPTVSLRKSDSFFSYDEYLEFNLEHEAEHIHGPECKHMLA